MRAVIAGGPCDQDLRLGEQQRAVTVGLDLKLPDIGAQPCLVLCRTDAGMHREDRGHYGESKQRQRGGYGRDFLAVEVIKS